MEKKEVIEKLNNISSDITLMIFRLNNDKDKISSLNHDLIEAQKHVLAAIAILERDDNRGRRKKEKQKSIRSKEK